MQSFKKHGRIIGITIFFLTFTSWLVAQDDLPGDSISVETHEPAIWALQFKINDGLSLGPLYGGNISIMRHTTPQSAFRCGLSLSVGMSTDSREEAGKEVGDTEDKSAGIILQIHSLKFPMPTARGRVYWGGGPVLSAFYSIEKENSIFIGGETQQIQLDLSIGAVVVLGYSWQVTQRLELFAEYQTELNLSYSYEEPKFPHKEEIKKGWGLSTQPGATVLGLSLYF